MKLPASVVRASLKYTVRPVFGPPFPIAFQRWYGDQMARTQRIPSSVTVVDVLLGGRRARRYAGPAARTDAAVLWVHGGAFITGSYATHGSFAAHLALAAGLPALTVAGHNMASRLGGSILHAAGLPQCVLESAADYVEIAVQLANNPAQLGALRRQLANNRQTAPLFDPAARVREWEAAWRHMVARQRAGLPPASFDVKILV